MGFAAKIIIRKAKDKIKNMVEGAKYFGSMEVVIGIPEETDVTRNGISNSQLLYLHENGVPSRNIPPRPVLKPAMAQKETQQQMRAIMKDAAIAAVLHGNKDECAANFEKAGMAGRDACKAYITAGTNLAPNAPSTIARKGSSMPLIDTGSLLNSISYVVRKKGG